MLFNSISFAIFFPIVTALYYILPHRWRHWLLLAASCVFYMAFIPAYVLILAVMILIDYTAAIYIERSEGRRKSAWFLLSILSTCSVLFVFKYFNFASENLSALAHFLGWNYPTRALDIILPIGLSFHTFQSLSYVIEVRRGRQKAERRLGVYALYVMFYPQLVAGPIERPQNLLRQFDEEHVFDYDRVTGGLRLMAWGLFKKIVIADRLAVYVNAVYEAPRDFTSLQLLTATCFFAYQIYCDFSGYSDIAIGAARVMGFRLMRNFDRPYGSKSIAEFWRRWHISLSSWLGDYVFQPLSSGLSRRVQGARVAGIKTEYLIYAVPIGATFLLSGLWHGANWTYVLWGALNGFYLILGVVTRRLRQGVRRLIGVPGRSTALDPARIAFTFALVSAGWILFRAQNLSDAWYIVTHLFSGVALGSITAGVPGFRGYEVGVAVAAILFLEAAQSLRQRRDVGAMLRTMPLYCRWSLYFGFVFVLACFGVYSRTQFIYFQF